MIKKLQNEERTEEQAIIDSTNDTVKVKPEYRADGICMSCNTYGEHLLKCSRCPVMFHGKECLGYDNPMGYRGRWLCYFCKVSKKGLLMERQVQTMPKEVRALKKVSSLVCK